MPYIRLPLSTRAALQAATRAPEPACVAALMERLGHAGSPGASPHALALRLAQGVRDHRYGLGKAGIVQSLLQEFALSSQEGVALMCLAEALLRIPDQATRDALIRDKIGRGNWQAHLGHSESLFVNAASWGLLLTGKLVATHSTGTLEGALRRVLGRGGEPVVRRGLDMAMRLMGEQFVTGQTIAQALDTARPREAAGFRYSYYMLGEAAMTMADAQRYQQAYVGAIQAIGAAAAGQGVIRGPGISIKLSALHPRYTRWQADRVQEELYPRLLALARLARQFDIGLNIDAEESERLELSVDLLERLCMESDLQGWQGLGFVVQAYQKRCPALIDHLLALARHSGRRLMVRLVKGAYWDSEIKRAQTEGQSDFPVYTRKPHTDLSYLACARTLLQAPDAVFPQFATHNAQTVAAIIEMAHEGLGAWHEGQYEFQCLHGMGEPLYEQVVSGRIGHRRPCRIYAPVGTHETLLAYLVRRLLENGANTSFVNRVANDAVPLETLVEDPVQAIRAAASSDGVLGQPHPAIALPAGMLGPGRRNSAGLDLHDEAVIARWTACGAAASSASPSPAAVDGPSAGRKQGRRALPPAPDDADPQSVERALVQAESAGPAWSLLAADERARILEAAADRFESQMWDWLELLADEAGKTIANGVAEVREAVDFLRYNAQQMRACARLGPTEPLGPVLCISPWNFPLAIFTGQIAAALAAGNAVLAKPAEQTPRVARRAVECLWEAGVPREVLHLLCGPGETVGAQLVADSRVQAVVFTGSTEVARLIQHRLAQRLDRRGEPVTLIAETGGLNAMIVDSSALPEQVTADVLASAFDSAGQRCSALRLLCVQDDVAASLLPMIRGAMEELRVGPAIVGSTDVGPVIDEAARQAIEDHVRMLMEQGIPVHRVKLPPDCADGCFVAPTLVELPHVGLVQREVFGPVLHVVRYAREDLPELLRAIAASGYGLTQGVHSRIDEFIEAVAQASRAGNLYVNRNMIGAVVGVQPFGGEGLSGTGPKAGGPLYLLRFLSRVQPGAARQLLQASGLTAASASTAASGATPHRGANGGATSVALALIAWLQTRGQASADLALRAQRLLDAAVTDDERMLPGPTGEANRYVAHGRDRVLCIARDEAALLEQTAAALSVGAQALWTSTWQGLHDQLPHGVAAQVAVAQDWRAAAAAFDAALVQGDDPTVLEVQRALAERPGPIIPLARTHHGAAAVSTLHLVRERTVSVNTAAAGGNASLMTIG